ncbi:class I SAM-dependent DNA methyltransferase [Hamadaea tsunoensis]|uniref:class I SAM-dependent DNA methyltransferase n=1 Tax=Hamadaea tsunoensis TaxID=53368 RepID=UPI000416BABD|nr:class I SAM-dependent methyltransferase [Hamadaea tsunoensis]
MSEPRPDLAHAFDTIAARYEDAFADRPGQREAVAWLLERLPPGGNVLDVGCGTGLPTAKQLIEGGAHVVGVDISPVMLDLAMDNVPDAIFVERDFTDLDGLHPVGERFHAAVAFFSLLALHRADIEKTLDAIRGQLDLGGLFALGMVEGDSDYLLREFLGEQVPLTAYPAGELRALLERHDFEVLDLRSESWRPPRGSDAPAQTHLYAYCEAREARNG